MTKRTYYETRDIRATDLNLDDIIDIDGKWHEVQEVVIDDDGSRVRVSRTRMGITAPKAFAPFDLVTLQVEVTE